MNTERESQMPTRHQTAKRMYRRNSAMDIGSER